MMRKAVGSRASLHARGFLAILVPLLVVASRPDRCEAASPGPVLLAMQAVGSQPRLVQLAPAMRIRDKAPEGWTHLVIKSIPGLESGDLDTLPDFATKTATMFHTTMVADVQPMGLDRQFVLTRVGLGICVPARDGSKDDVVVTSDRMEAMSIKLSTVEQMVLEAAEAELAESRIIAFTSTFALLRSPSMLLVQGKHRKVDLYYAFCVDSTTGKLRVGAWSMWPGDVSQPPPPFIIQVAPRTIYKCAVDVQAKKILFGTVPYSWTFAMRKLPPGESLTIKGDKALGEEIVTIARHPNQVATAAFEKKLRKVLFDAPDPAPPDRAPAKTAGARTSARRSLSSR